MKLPFPKFFPNYRNCAALSIARASLLFSALLTSPVIADPVSSNSVESIKANVDDIANDTASILTAINGVENKVGDQTQDIERTAIAAEALIQRLAGSTDGNVNYYDRDNALYYMRVLTHFLTGQDQPNVNAVVSSRHPSLPQLLDALNGGSAWWATNSAFALTKTHYSKVYPGEYPDDAGTFSFPQFLSVWSGLLTYPQGSTQQTPGRNWFNWFGSKRFQGLTPSTSTRNPYTFFDWMADAMRSNIIAQTTIELTDATNTIAQESLVTGSGNYVDNGQNLATNTIVDNDDYQPDYDDFKPPAGTFDEIDDLVTALPSSEDLQNSLPSSFTGGDWSLELFPGGTYGSVSVPRVVASLEPNWEVSLILNLLFSWLWRLLAFCSCFAIVKQEIAFWSTLGGSTSDA